LLSILLEQKYFKMKNQYYFTFYSSIQILCAALVILLSGCSEEKLEIQEQTVVQVSTIDALMMGIYDGTTTLENLSEWGDFGIGTFNKLDGEMLLLDGTYYQVKADGHVYKPESELKTPFATVTFFNPEVTYNVSDFSYNKLKTKVDSLFLSTNLFYAIKLHGTFHSVKTRSVPAQQEPYPSLLEVTKNQPKFEAKSVMGTLSGFYCPPFVRGINVPGYHLHFISDELDFGGHVLEFELEKGFLELDQINNFRLFLPTEGDFLETNLNEDLSGDLEEVEGS